MARLALADAIIVGSGASGGWAAKQLSEAGMSVSLFEAGGLTKSGDLRRIASWPAHSYTAVPPSLNESRPIQSQCYACRDARVPWFVNDQESPYEQSAPYTWIRMQGVAGRLLAWEGQSYRMSDLDFKAASQDGFGVDWPLCYADLEPYYDVVERYIGVTGRGERLKQLPDGPFLPPSKVNISDTVLRPAVTKEHGRYVTPARLAQMTCDHQLPEYSIRAQNPFSNTDNVAGSTYWKTLYDAENTTRLSLYCNTRVTNILTKDGRAIGVAFVDKSGRHGEAYGRVIVLCASALESTRLLLQSDIFNSSGTLGHFLMDHQFGAGASGRMEVPTSILSQPDTERHRIYVPRFRNIGDRQERSFVRGYGFQGKSVLMTPEDTWSGSAGNTVSMKLILSAFGESLARYSNYVELSATERDKWGMPTLRINAKWCNNEAVMMRDAAQEATKILEMAGLKELRSTEHFSVPGLSIHEMGTARMGVDPSSSVVNSYCQSHDVSNVFVTDGACWPSGGCQNPTLTIMAITLRACNFIIKNFRSGFVASASAYSHIDV